MSTRTIRNMAVARNEIIRITNENEGLCRPPDVVEAARPRRAPLHPYFDWDDTEAAEKWRLQQARQLISAVVIYAPPNPKLEMRMMVSLSTDRRLEGGGYRFTTEVLTVDAYRKQFWSDLRRQWAHFKRMFAQFEELAEAFGVMDAAIEQVELRDISLQVNK